MHFYKDFEAALVSMCINPLDEQLISQLQSDVVIEAERRADLIRYERDLLAYGHRF